MTRLRYSSRNESELMVASLHSRNKHHALIKDNLHDTENNGVVAQCFKMDLKEIEKVGRHPIEQLFKCIS